MSGGLKITRVLELPPEVAGLASRGLAEGFRAIDALRRDWESGDNRFDAPGEALFAAHLDGELVGVCGLNVDAYLDDPDTARVRRLYVLPEHRRCGVARALVSQTLHHAHGRFQRVRLRTPQRLDANGFYDALGFTRTPGEDAATHAMAPPFFVARDKPMADGLARFLAGRTPDVVEPLRWGHHALQLRGYLTQAPPPAEYLLAGRAIVRDGRGDVLVCESRTGKHVLPGGRLEDGEDGAAAARREVLEETGWDVEVERPLGLLHLYYETPEPTDVGRVIYPDFLWQVFQARALRHRPEAMLPDDFELDHELLPRGRARAVVRHDMERVLLDAAL